jgi:RHS repeat-associated protein
MKRDKTSVAWIVPCLIGLMAAALHLVWADCGTLNCACPVAGAWIATLDVETSGRPARTITWGAAGLPCNNDFCGGGWGGCSGVTNCSAPGWFSDTGIRAEVLATSCNGPVEWHFHDPLRTGQLTITNTVSTTFGGGSTASAVCQQAVVVPQDNDVPSGCSGCGGGSGGLGAGTAGATLGAGAVNNGTDGGGVDFRLSLGPATPQQDAGFLWLHGPAPAAALAQPAGLRYLFNAPGVLIVSNNAAISQVLTPLGMVNIVTNSDRAYQLQCYYAADVVTNNNNNPPTYGTNGLPPFAIWVVTNANSGTNYSQLTISEVRDGAERDFGFDYTAGSLEWDLTLPGGSTKISVSQVGIDGTHTNYVREVWSGTQLVRSNQKTYLYVSASVPILLAQEIEGVSPLSRTNSYTYYPTNSGASSNLVQRIDYWDGRWVYYVYDSLGRKQTEFGTYLNYPAPAAGTVPAPLTNPCKEIDYSYTLGAGDGTSDDGTLNPWTPRKISVKVPVSGAMREISRTYHEVEGNPAPQGQPIVIYEEEQVCPNSTADGSGALWGQSGNLITTTYESTNQDFSYGLPVLVERPDDTVSIFGYSTNSDGSQTTTESAGQPDSTANPTTVVQGTETVTDVDSLGRIASRTVYAIQPGLTNQVTLASSTYDYVTPGDPSGRSYNLSDLAQRQTQYRYDDCCGLDNVTDPDGVITYYLYDANMKWLLGTSRVVGVGGSQNTIQTTNVLDALGRVLATVRAGTLGGSTTVITQSQSAYDILGRLVSTTNALGGVTSYGYTNFIDNGSADSQLITTNIYPDGGSRVEIRSRDGSLAQLLGSAVQGVSHLYDIEVDGTLYRLCDTATNLNSSGGLSQEWTKTVLDGAGRVYETLYAAPSGAGTPMSQTLYNEYGQVWKVVDPDNVTTLYTYNGQGQHEYTIQALSSLALGFTNYDAMLGDLAAIQSGTDRVTQVEQTVVAAAGSQPNLVETDTYVYDSGNSSGTLASTSQASCDGLSQWSKVYRDASTPVITSSISTTGTTRTVTQTMPAGAQTVSLYVYGRLQSVTQKDANGVQTGQTTNAYDGHGRTCAVTDARNGTASYAFTNSDQVVASTTPLPGPGQAPQTTTTCYDTSLRAWKITYPDNTSLTNRFGVTGLLTNTSGSRAYPVAYTYDYAGRMNTMTTRTNYAAGSGAATTTWNYDIYRGWLTNKTYAGGAAGPLYGYTAAGRLASRTWARGTNTAYAYLNSGDLYTVTYSDGTPGLAYSYDRRGRQATIARNGTTTTLAYNNADQVLTEANSGGALGGLTVTNGYDAYLRRNSLVLQQSSTPLIQQSFAYDAASRLQSVSDGNNNSAAYSYVANSPLVGQIAFTNSSAWRMTTAKQYDYLNRLAAISSAPSGASALSYSYQYNSANQRARTTLADGSSWLYTYDPLGQVIAGDKYWADQTPVAGQQFQYGFDNIGNRTSTGAGGDQNGENLRSASYTANNLNQYAQRTVPGYVDIMGLGFANNTVTVNGLTAYRKGEYFREQLSVANGSAPVWQPITNSQTGQTTVTGNLFVAKTPEAFAYDADGNLTSDGRWTYTWDAESRLVRMTNNTAVGPQQLITFVYDWKGRRIQKQVSANGTMTNNVTFVYDGWNPIAKLNATNSSVLQSYVWGLDLSGSMQGAGGVGGLLEVGDAVNGVHFAAYDGNWNIAGLVKAADGTSSAVYEYGPFGEVIRGTGLMAKANCFRFSTKFQDDETDLLYYGYRYYSASAGRWHSRDPLGETGGFNVFAFVGNDPGNWVDTNGRTRFGGRDGVNISLDLPPTPKKCRQVNNLLDLWAVGVNQGLLDHWRSGSGTTTTLNFNDFDTGGIARSQTLNQALRSGIGGAGGLPCNKSNILEFNSPEPSSSNEYNYTATPMIYGWRYWYECKVYVTKLCPPNSCCLLRIHADCQFHALDQVDFWNNDLSSFWVPGFTISDRLVRACNPNGRGFQVNAASRGSGTAHASCDGSSFLPWNPDTF